MTTQAVVSVRGFASRTVTPDSVALRVDIRTAGEDKGAALSAAATVADTLSAALSELGGRVLTSEQLRAPLGWLVGPTRSFEEREYVESAQRNALTGRMGANTTVLIRARDYALLGVLGQALARIEKVHLVQATWAVDEDNPAWSEVRTEAISEAVSKARDYARALHGSLVRIEQLADSGLLDGSSSGERVLQAARARSLAGGGPDGVEAPSLDVVPQVISATVDARFVAEVAELS